MPRNFARSLNRNESSPYPETEDERAVLESDQGRSIEPRSRSASKRSSRQADGNDAPHGDAPEQPETD